MILSSDGTMLPTGTVTFLFSDIEGSTPLWEREPGKMAEALQTHNAVLHQAIETHGGVVFKTVGDEFQAAFSTATQATQAAIAGQRALAGANWNELGELKVRMGLHTGEAELDPNGDEYVVSHTKNRASRIMSAAHGGQILLSRETAGLLQQSIPEDVFLKDLGELRLKGLSTLEHIYQVCAQGLPQEFPQLTTAVSHPTSLPLQLTSFIGREQETREVIELMDRNRLVTLTGPGGTGKTRLSLRVAEEVLKWFPNGVWFVGLSELVNPELLPGAITAVLGLQESLNRATLDQLVDYLNQKQLLIILDNCEHVISECARVSEILLQNCPKLKILASSREILRVSGEITYQVPSLSVPDLQEKLPLESLSHFSAIQLFADRAAGVVSDFGISNENAENIAKICRRLDGIPLAIELAAARVSSLTVEQIAARLDNRFRLLTSGSRTAMPRQQTLQASIDWSYSLLEESERLLFMRLSVFHGGWTLELASEVCSFNELDEFDVLDGLSQLVNKSLIQSVSGTNGSRRYHQLETIRAYAREKLIEAGAEETLRNRHLDAFAHLIESAEPNLRGQHQVDWLDQLELELDNLRASLEWAAVENPQKGLYLATSMFWFWNNRGPRSEGESWLRQLQERLGDPSDVDLTLLATARVRQAHLQMSIGRLGKEVSQTAKEALDLVEQLGDKGKPIRAIALWVLAIYKKQLGQNTWAHDLGRQCLELASELGDRFMIAESYEALIDIESDPTNARHFAEKHLALRKELGDLDGEMIAHFYMAISKFWSGDLAEACQLCEQGMEIARVVKNLWGLMEGHSILGYIYRSKGDAARAINHFQQALAIVQDSGEEGRIVRQLNLLGCAYASKGEWLDAERYVKQAIQISRKNRFTLWEIISCINLAEVAYGFDHMDLAINYYQAAADVNCNQENTFLVGLITYGNGKAALLQDDRQLAGKYFRKALKDSAETGNHGVMKFSLQALAVCAVHSGMFPRAILIHGWITSRDWLLWPLNIPWLVPFNLDALLVPSRKTFGDGEYTHLLAQGQAMTLDQAVEFALEDARE